MQKKNLLFLVFLLFAFLLFNNIYAANRATTDVEVRVITESLEEEHGVYFSPEDQSNKSVVKEILLKGKKLFQILNPQVEIMEKIAKKIIEQFTK